LFKRTLRRIFFKSFFFEKVYSTFLIENTTRTLLKFIRYSKAHLHLIFILKTHQNSSLLIQIKIPHLLFLKRSKLSFGIFLLFFIILAHILHFIPLFSFSKRVLNLLHSISKSNSQNLFSF